MRSIRAMLRAGAAVVAIFGFAGVAAAQGPQTHVMNLMLPDGGVAHIRYTGDIAPTVSIGDSPMTVAAFPSLFGNGSPFAEMERISAAMDQQAAQLFREAAAIQANPGLIDVWTPGKLPPGAREYQFVSTISGNGVCSRSVEITSMGSGATPKVVSHTSGNCGAESRGFQVPTQQQLVPARDNGPKMIMTKATGVHPYAGRVQEASLR